MLNMIINNPVLGGLVSFICFFIGLKISYRMKHPIFNPLLIAIALIIGFLKLIDMDYEIYKAQTSVLSYFLGPATVALAVPLYKNIDVLKKNFAAILTGVFAGSVVSIGSVVGMGILLGANKEILLSMLPKAVTTPIAMEVSAILGGIPALTAGLVAITGIFGACFAPEILKIFGIKDKVAIGIAIGTTTHALGTTRAFQEGEVEGAMSSLSIGVAGLITAFLAPYIGMWIK